MEQLSLLERTNRINEIDMHIESADQYIQYLKQDNDLVDQLLKFPRTSMESPEFKQLYNQRIQLWETYEAARNNQLTI
jgi:hypothetical protein